MKRILVAALVASSLSAPIFALAAEGDQQASRAERMQQWAADRATMLDAKLDSLDESQKHKFGMLGRMLMPERSRFAMDMMHHHMGEHDHDGAE